MSSISFKKQLTVGKEIDVTREMVKDASANGQCDPGILQILFARKDA
jgi:hypothetical protein